MEPNTPPESPVATGPVTTGPVTTAPSTINGEERFARNRLRAGNWVLVLMRGLIAVAVALAAFLVPWATIASLVLLFLAYMLVDGVFAISSGVRAARERERWGWFILEGLADIAAVIIALIWPAITVLAFVLLIAAWAVVSGVMMLIAAFRLTTRHGRGWLVLAAAFSLSWGVLLVVAPGAGAIAMTWWLGAYALVFGLALIVFAWRLRIARRRDLEYTNVGPLGSRA